MNIYSAQQIHALDAATLELQGISSDMLMERAAVQFVHLLLKNHASTRHFVIACGIGNNGGDGLCIARLLHLKGYRVTLLILGDIQTGSADAQSNYQRSQQLGIDTFHLSAGERIPWFDEVVVIDAIFGIGLNKPITGWLADCIHDLNELPAIRIAVDIPSGLSADVPASGMILCADQAISFQTPKLSFFFPENEKYLGSWQIADIGLSKNWQLQEPSMYQFIQADAFKSNLIPRAKFSHKGNHGHSLVIAGNTGTPGAADLCASACLHTGAGLVTLCCDHPQFEHPEIMYTGRAGIRDLLSGHKYQAIAIGPGLGTDADSIDLVSTVLNTVQQPLVIDADAINIIAAHPILAGRIPPNSILTPHPKEWSRLAGTPTDWLTLLNTLRETAIRLNCIIVYKQAFTIIATPDGICSFNSSGNPGMATAGSGDVLTGVITGLLAQGYASEFAAKAGVFLHGLAGDVAMQKRRGQNIVAGDLLYNLQEAYHFIL